MAGFGFSINTLTMCGLILAIGLVVDDAIIVVENVEKYLDRGMRPLEATRAAMAEITTPIITISLVLAAVFVPVAFIPGLTGRLYNQFAHDDRLLVPLLGVQLTHVHAGDVAAVPEGKTRRDEVLPFRWFNRGMKWLEDSYDSVLEAARGTGGPSSSPR